MRKKLVAGPGIDVCALSRTKPVKLLTLVTVMIDDPFAP